MSFWNSFVKVWEVRTSIKIQEGIENLFSKRRSKRQNFDNSAEIINELVKKNSNWNDKINNERNKL